MTLNEDAVLNRARKAVELYWQERSGQSDKARTRDTGTRSEVTGGRHMDAFRDLFADIALSAGYRREDVAVDKDVTIPGFYRPTKKWDLVVFRDDRLVCAMELKSQVGPSFGNNFNNRSEEAIGNAGDFWRAFRAEIFGVRPPWLGYLLLLEDADKSRAPVAIPRTRQPVLPEFKNTSYIDRYGLLLSKLVTERQYSSAAYLVSPRGNNGDFREPVRDMGVSVFYRSFLAHLLANK